MNCEFIFRSFRISRQKYEINQMRYEMKSIATYRPNFSLISSLQFLYEKFVISFQQKVAIWKKKRNWRRKFYFGFRWINQMIIYGIFSHKHSTERAYRHDTNRRANAIRKQWNSNGNLLCQSGEWNFRKYSHSHTRITHDLNAMVSLSVLRKLWSSLHICEFAESTK